MSASLDLIRQALVELVDGENADTVESQAAATNICTMALSDVQEKDRDMVASLLFNSERGILGFLKRSLDKSIHANAKVIFLEFTAEYISRSPSALTPFILDIKKVCLSLFLNDNVAKVKKAAILPIKILLPSSQKTIDPSVLDIQGLFAKLYTVYATQQTKTASTVKAEILELMGIIARYYPTVAEERSSTLLRWCITVIQDQLKPGSKYEMSLVAGALLGLDNTLFSFSNKVERDIRTILDLVMKLINIPEDLSRFATPVAALDLFAHHISLFRPHLIDIYEWIYQKITGYCEHSSSRMYKTGFQALDVFLKEMAEILTSSPITEREYNCFLFFTTNFTQILRTDVVSSATQYKAMSVAIRGYGYFAAPCKLISPDQLPFLLTHLLKKSAFLVST
ncbi:hypothetical protein BGZ94_008743, partial [Podila epigama]